jgi:hypothetical protein
MPTENRVFLDRNRATSLAAVKSGRVFASELSVYNRKEHELPGKVSSISLFFYNEGGAEVELKFYKPDSFQIILFPIRKDFALNYDFCRIGKVTGELLEKDELVLYFYPPITTW